MIPRPHGGNGVSAEPEDELERARAENTEALERLRLVMEQRAATPTPVAVPIDLVGVAKAMLDVHNCGCRTCRSLTDVLKAF